MTENWIWIGGLWDEEPCAFAPVAEWERYLAMVDAMSSTADAIPSKESLVRSAREMIRFKRRTARQER